MSGCWRAVLAAVLMCVGTAWAQTPAPPDRKIASTAEDGPKWASLTPAQQSALSPLRQLWPTLDGNRKTKWLVVAQRFPGMPAAERDRVQARMAEWARLPPAERGRARQSFQELRALPAPDRQALWDAYRALPPERRQQLAQKARTPAPAASEPQAQADGRRKVAISPRAVQVRPVTPTVVQANPGGTTTLLTKPPAPPVHHQPGMPKILAGKDFVNPSTLLPSRGPQGAAALPPARPASAASQPRSAP